MSGDRSAMKERLLLALIPFFVLFALFLNALHLLDISLLHAEVGLLACSLFAACLALGALLAAAGAKLRAALLAFFTFIVIDVSASGWTQLNFVSGVTHSHLLGYVLRGFFILATIVFLYAVLWRLRTHAPKILAGVFGVIFATTIAFTTPPFDRLASTSALDVRKPVTHTQREQLPVRVHLVFDEMTAAEAIDRRLENGEELYRRTRDFFSRNNFRLYGQVYSRFRATFRSLSSLVNFDSTSIEPLPKYTDGGERPDLIHTNAYFREAADMGYEIHVFQTRHFNFCSVLHVTKCETLNSYSPVSRFMLQRDFGFLSRTANLAAIMSTAFSGSSVSHIVGTLLNKVGDFGAWFDTDAFPAWFDHVAQRIVEAPRGTVIFAHFLVPHAPYALDADCARKERIPMHYRASKAPRDETTWPAFRARYKARYYEQSLCIYRKLDELMHALDVSGRFDDAIFIIHSDHGSRISRSDHAEHMSERDVIANYATLFAIRKPDVPPGYDLELVSLQDVFARHVQQGKNGGMQQNARAVTNREMPAVSEAEAWDTIVVRRAATDMLEEARMPPFAKH